MLFILPVQFLDNQLEGDQTLDRNCTWLCILRDHGLSFCNPCNTFQGQMNGAHSESPDAHSGPFSAHTEPPDAHMEPPNLFCHLHDNFLDNHYTIVVL